jgi:hypothetical protein
MMFFLVWHFGGEFFWKTKKARRIGLRLKRQLKENGNALKTAWNMTLKRTMKNTAKKTTWKKRNGKIKTSGLFAFFSA